MDDELRFIAKLLQANIANQDAFFAQQIPQKIFRQRKVEAKWLYGFYEKHGSCPTKSVFNSRFGTRLPKIRGTVRTMLQPLLDFDMYEQMQLVSNRTKEMIDEGESISDSMGYYRSASQSLTDYQITSADVDVGSRSYALSRYRQRAKSAAEGTLIKFDTPWPTMNRMVSFFAPKEVALWTSRTSIGKTWTLLYWLTHLAANGVSVLLVSLEMSEEAISDRLEALFCGLDYKRLRNGTLTPTEMRHWISKRKAFNKLKQKFIIVGSDGMGSGFSLITSKIAQYQCDVNAIDGAYLIFPEELKADVSDVKRFSLISHRCKSLAKSTNSLMIPVVQQNRNAEDKGVAKGSLSTIYGADAWGQDADWVFEVRGSRDTPVRELALIKGRESAIGSIPINFRLDPPRFDEQFSTVIQTASTNSVKMRKVV